MPDIQEVGGAGKFSVGKNDRMPSPRILLYKCPPYLIYYVQVMGTGYLGSHPDCRPGVPRPRSPTTSPYTGLHYQGEHGDNGDVVESDEGDRTAPRPRRSVGIFLEVCWNGSRVSLAARDRFKDTDMPTPEDITPAGSG